MSEHKEQCALIEYASYKDWGEDLFAIPNGGLRNIRVAAKLKKEGVRAGIPDLMLAIPNDNHPGMFIEMKYGKNGTTRTQKERIARLRRRGYYCCVCYNSKDAIDQIEAYLRNEYHEGAEGLSE